MHPLSRGGAWRAMHRDDIRRALQKGTRRHPWVRKQISVYLSGSSHSHRMTHFLRGSPHSHRMFPRIMSASD